MTKVTAFEAKTHFGKLLDRVSRGEEVVITRHDKPVARLIPEGAQRPHEVREAVAGLRELQQQIRRRSKGGSNTAGREGFCCANTCTRMALIPPRPTPASRNTT